MSTKAGSALRQVIIYLDQPDYAKLEDLRKQAPYKLSMSAYAGGVLKQALTKKK